MLKVKVDLVRFHFYQLLQSINHVQISVVVEVAKVTWRSTVKQRDTTWLIQIKVKIIISQPDLINYPQLILFICSKYKNKLQLKIWWSNKWRTWMKPSIVVDGNGSHVTFSGIGVAEHDHRWLDENFTAFVWTQHLLSDRVDDLVHV